jgi:hypothetical protein
VTNPLKESRITADEVDEDITVEQGTHAGSSSGS